MSAGVPVELIGPPTPVHWIRNAEDILVWWCLGTDEWDFWGTRWQNDLYTGDPDKVTCQACKEREAKELATKKPL